MELRREGAMGSLALLVITVFTIVFVLLLWLGILMIGMVLGMVLGMLLSLLSQVGMMMVKKDMRLRLLMLIMNTSKVHRIVD